MATPSVPIMRPGHAMYRLFEVTGIELEYAVTDQRLVPQCLVEDAFRLTAGRPVSEIELGRVGFSNELAAHVFEIKTRRPERSLRAAERHLVAGLRRFARVLREHFGAQLLPTGMHPFMQPRDTRLWGRAGRQIYEAYARVFDVQEHGWLNVQSCHVNLPFGTEEETVLLHNAIACVLPYLPALAASSPVYGGRIGRFVDNRLAFYRVNQRCIPCITGAVVPEYMTSYRQYRREVLAPIYAALRGVRGGRRLCHEWVNSRGAILRFDRRAIEIRALDTQECVKMDIAIAIFIRALLKRLVDRLRSGALSLPDHRMLVADFNAVVRDGTQAEVAAAHLRRRAGGTATAGSVLLGLLASAEEETPPAERPYLNLVEGRLRDGNLSERVRAAVQRRSGSHARRRGEVIRAVYGELADCLYRNVPWDGR